MGFVQGRKKEKERKNYYMQLLLASLRKRNKLHFTQSF